MIIAVDTNVLLRHLVGDDEEQAAQATALLSQATEIVIPTTVFCELVWVLMRSYHIPREKVIDTITKLSSDDKIICEQSTIAAGLAYLCQGGDFADGVLTRQAIRLGADTLASFDNKSLKLLQQNHAAILRGLNPSRQ